MPPTTTIATTDVKLDLLFEQYLTRLRNRNRRPQTIANFVRSVVPFQHWLNEQGIDAAAVKEDDMFDYFGSADYHARYAQGTRRLHAVQIRAAYAYAHRRGQITADPFVDFELPKEPDPKREEIPSAELRAIRERCGLRPKLVALWGLLVYTGLRRDEIRRLAWENINLSDWSITINGKGNKRRTIPVHPDLQEILRDLPDRNAYTNPELREGPVLWTEQTHKEYAEGRSFEKLKLRITDRPFHAFRKTVGTSLGRNGVRTEDIKRILGWAASDIFQKHYYSVNLDDLHRAILRLYADDPISA